jgi:hypothetical protein
MITTPVLLLLLTAQTAPPPPPSNSGTEQVIGPDKGGVDDALGRAATRPLRDLNVMKPKIEQDLANIMANPYAVKSLRTCRQLNAEVNHMTLLVGPDVDDPALVGKKGRSPGIIRQITGANKAARQAAAARLAGQIRRSYIKGIMKARGCRLVPAPPEKPAPKK